MTLHDWLRESHERFDELPARTAARLSAQQFGLGALRRVTTDFGMGTTIWERDEWDICCVLDACRLDLMQEVAQTGTYPWLDANDIGSLWSVGSASPEWLDQTFHSGYADEKARTAYITANPFSAKPAERAATAETDALPLTDGEFAHFEEVWRTDWRDEPVSVVPPRALTDRAIDVWRRREKLGVERMVIHYMQPHIPFRARPEWFGKREDLEIFGEPDKEGGKDPWKCVRDGDIPAAEFWDAYRDNLEWVLDDMDLLRENADATIALTSDHGNAMGEWGTWSHPPGSPIPVLRRVPWVETTGRDTGAHTPVVSEEDVDESGLDDRLAALGYV